MIISALGFDMGSLFDYGRPLGHAQAHLVLNGAVT